MQIDNLIRDSILAYNLTDLMNNFHAYDSCQSDAFSPLYLSTITAYI